MSLIWEGGYNADNAYNAHRSGIATARSVEVGAGLDADVDDPRWELWAEAGYYPEQQSLTAGVVISLFAGDIKRGMERLAAVLIARWI
jgi:hypothetical protein